MKYSIIIPCYCSELTIGKVVKATIKEFKQLNYDSFEFILVDDCSPDKGKTVAELIKLSDEYSFITVIELAKNAGQHNAIMAGLNYASGDFIILMDDDGQTHPSQLKQLIEKFDEGYDVVYGYYPDKKHSAFRNFGSWVNYATVRILIGKPKDIRTSSYCLMRKYVRDYIIQYPAQYTHMQGLVLRTVSTSKIASVPIEHFERLHGSSNYTFRKLLSLWSNIAGFSTVPLQISKRCGAAISLLGVAGIIWLLVRKFMHNTQILGWTSTMLSIIFFSGVILMTLGIVGEYVGKTFLTMGKYPQYVIRDIHKKES